MGDKFGLSGTDFLRINVACPQEDLKTALNYMKEVL